MYALIFTFRPPTTSTPFPYTTLFRSPRRSRVAGRRRRPAHRVLPHTHVRVRRQGRTWRDGIFGPERQDRKSTRLNSSHVKNSYAVFCLNNKIYYTFRLHLLIHLLNT